MQILHITDNLKVGGSQLVLVDLANQQAAAGHRVAIAAGSGELWAELAPEIVRYEHSSERLSRRVLLPVVRRLLKARRWDIVHTHQRGVSSAVWLTRYGIDFAHVEHVHAIFADQSFRRSSFRGDALIACGSAVAQMLISDYGRDPHKVHTVPNGVRDHGVRRMPHTSAETPLRILNIGRVDEEKDPIRFVHVLAELNDREIPFRATWIGDGRLLEPTRRLIEEVALSSKVEFPGGRRPAVTALSDADVFLLTSTTEGLPLSVIEAAAAGCAVVAPHVGSMSDVIRQGHNGWLYPSSARPSEIADLLVEALAAPGSLDRAGSHARQVYEQKFQFSRVSKDIERVYEQLAQ